MPSELERRIIRAEKLGQEWAKADTLFFQLDEAKKSLLGSLISDLDDSKTSEAKLERIARTQKVWKDYIQNLSVARGEMLRCKVRYQSAVAFYEACRTNEATKRVELQVLRDKP